MNDKHNFASLTPDAVLSALESLGLPCDGRLQALNSYENRVYQVGLDDAPPMIAKFYRAARWSDAAILEEHEFVAQLVAAELPIVPATILQSHTLHHFNGFRFALFAKQGGRAPELDSSATLQWLGRFLGRIHAIGATQNYMQRPALDVQSFGVEPSEFLLAHDFIPRDLREVYRGLVTHALDSVRRNFDRAGEVKNLRLHGDCHAGNVLWTDDGPHFVDFDDSRMGPAIQDLWMLLSGDRAEQTRQFADLLSGYEDFYDFNPREMHLLEALRTLRLIHYAAWLAKRWDDAAFPVAFPWFNTPLYWQNRILELREQIALMDEAPLNC
ncbi:MAG: serine/threonine protein kinase [Sideroxydans sp.]|nr:serine/threonine protein kinase [Sideroxydans sp.]